ncbi:FCS-Like Zinc finger 6 [Linum grandiflorum]
MLLRKRPRAPDMMRRTTSMSGITVDPSLPHPPADLVHGGGSRNIQRELIENHYLASMVSPRSSLTAAETTTSSHFLRTCGLCRHRIPPSNDIYMYRGDTAFCSQECREEQMKKDERKEKRSQQRSKLSTSTPPSNREDIFIGGSQYPTIPTSTS